MIFNSLARKTTKSDSLSHGFGLSIIEEIVKSYDGFCEWEDRGNIFESRIMLRYLYNTTANEYVLSWNIFEKCFLQIEVCRLQE